MDDKHAANLPLEEQLKQTQKARDEALVIGHVSANEARIHKVEALAYRSQLMRSLRDSEGYREERDDLKMQLAASQAERAELIRQREELRGELRSQRRKGEEQEQSIKRYVQTVASLKARIK